MTSPRVSKTQQETIDPATLTVAMTETPVYPQANTPDFFPVMRPGTPSSQQLSDQVRLDLQSPNGAEAELDFSFEWEAVSLAPLQLPATPVLKPTANHNLNANEAPMPNLKIYSEAATPLQPLTQRPLQKKASRSTLDEAGLQPLLNAAQQQEGRRNTILFAFNENPALLNVSGSVGFSNANSSSEPSAFSLNGRIPSRPILSPLSASFFHRAPQVIPGTELVRRRRQPFLNPNRQNQVDSDNNVAAAARLVPKPPSAPRF
jgi:hypothetical protein